MNNNNPSINPANNETLVGSISFAFSKLLQQTDGMLPAQVVSYDREKNRVRIQILITLVTTGGEQVPRPVLDSIPVLVAGGGGFTLSFPLNEGDLGWVLANDRDISLFLGTYAQAQPNTARIKNFSDAIFIPDVMRTYNVTMANNGYVTLASIDGKASISMGINTTYGDTEINIIADRVNISLNDPLLGLVAVAGNITASGTITPGTPPLPYPP